MGRSRYKVFEEHYPYFITSSFSQGLSLSTDPDVACILLDSLDFIQKNFGITIYAYVIMHNHIHCIGEGEDLSLTLRKFKSFTARRIINHLKAHKRSYFLKRLKINSEDGEGTYRVWQKGFHPKQISDSDMMIQKIEYIHNNPIKTGFVDKPLDWRYSSARNYEGLEPLLSVTLFKG